MAGQHCQGQRYQHRGCNQDYCTTTTQTTPFIKPSEWNKWAAWTTCSKECNSGQQTRRYDKFYITIMFNTIITAVPVKRTVGEICAMEWPRKNEFAIVALVQQLRPPPQ